MSFVALPEIETDPDELAEIAFEYLGAVLPDWAPVLDGGDAMTELIRAQARIVAEERDVAGNVPTAILRALGERVYRLPPIESAPARVSATVTFRDDAGYTIEGGVEVFVATAGDDGVTFSVVAPVTVEPRRGTSTSRGEVTLQAIPGFEGTIGNGLTSANPARIIRSWAAIESIVLVGESSEGVDAEDDDAYLVRLVRELSLSSPVPIHLADHSALARRHSLVTRCLALNLTKRVDEIVEISHTGSGTGTLTDRATGGAVSLTSGATASSIAAAFAALTPRTGARYSAAATGGPLGTAPVVVSLRGRAAYGPWQLSSTGPTVTAAVTQLGGDATEIPQAVALIPVGPRGLPLSSGARAEVAALVAATREVGWRTSIIDPTYTAIDATYAAVCEAGEDPDAVNAAAAEALRSYFAPENWGTGRRREDAEWIDEPIVRYLEVAQVLNEVSGLRYLTDLRIGVEGGPLSAADITLPGPAPLTRPGAGISGTVTEG